ncbi:AraC family transcriptional regulator [Photobacterium satsumensis]|uniref:AraC family transcriptional regulator n=1 Tax=Photobacterium satsumensis TaxID=2910239 RepID=UPI003D095F11
MSELISSVLLPKGKPLRVEFIEGNSRGLFSQPHRHEYYEIVWAQKGTGSHCIDFIEYPLNEGDIYFISPGQVHSDTKTSGKICLITFQPDFVENNYRGQLIIDQTFYHEKTSASAILIDTQGTRDLADLIRILSQEVSREETNWRLVNSLLHSFLSYIQRFHEKEIKSDTLLEQRMYKLYVLIDEYFRTEKKTDFYANHLAVSNKRANEISRQQCGKTITKLIQDRTLLDARRELAFTSKTVKQIAHELGYEDVAYFCRFFRKAANESPLDFRAKMFK